MVKKANPRARIGKKLLLGCADVILKKTNLSSARIGIKLLLGGADVVLKKQSPPARTGVLLSLVGTDVIVKKPKTVSQDWGKGYKDPPL